MSEFRTPEQMFVCGVMEKKVEKEGVIPTLPVLLQEMGDLLEAWRTTWPIEEAKRVEMEFESMTAPVVVDDGGSRGLQPTPGLPKLVIPRRPEGLPAPDPAGKIDSEGRWLSAKVGMGKKTVTLFNKTWREMTWAEALQLQRGRDDEEINFVEWMATKLDPSDARDTQGKQIWNMTKLRAIEVMDRLGRTERTPY